MIQKSWPAAQRGARRDDAAGSDVLMLQVRRLRRLNITASFTLGGGECIAVQGPSGSGKTLLLRAIADLDPNDGIVELDGVLRESMPAPRWRRQVTYVAAVPGWWADTVQEHFTDWGEVLPLVEGLGLPPLCADWPITRLSSGEAQRLALVRALALHSRVLLLDEPTSALDPGATAIVEATIAERRSAGTGVIWVSHDVAQARRVASRLLVLTDGQVEEQSW